MQEGIYAKFETAVSQFIWNYQIYKLDNSSVDNIYFILPNILTQNVYALNPENLNNTLIIILNM